MINDDLFGQLSELVEVKIKKAEIVSHERMIRLIFSNDFYVKFCGNWRLRNEQTMIFGALDIDSFLGFTDEELEDEFERLDKKYTKKIKRLEGKKLLKVKSIGNDIFLEISDSLFLDLFDLSFEGINAIVLEYR